MGKRILIALSVLVLGWVVSIAAIALGFWLLAASEDGGFAGAGAGGIGAILGVFVLIVERPWEMSVVLLGVGGLFLHTAIAQKSILQAVLRSVWNAGEERFLVSTVTRAVDSLHKASPDWLRGAAKWGAAKTNVLRALREDPETGKAQKWAMGKVLDRLPVETELPTNHEALPEFLSVEIRRGMTALLTPNAKFLRVLFALQLGVALVATIVVKLR